MKIIQSILTVMCAIAFTNACLVLDANLRSQPAPEKLLELSQTMANRLALCLARWTRTLIHWLASKATLHSRGCECC